MKKPLSSEISAALDALKKGEFVILVDSEDRENEGDLVLAAEFATPEKINFLIRQACGLVCLALESDQIDRLGLPLMVTDNQSPRTTAFTVSIEAAKGVSTGISAQDRAHTILVASDPNSTRADVHAPGHVFPLRAVPGGVLERAGHTEGSIELCKLAGLRPSAVICEIINEDGTMARRPDLDRFAKKFNIPVVTIEDLISSIEFISSEVAKLPAEDHFWVQAFRNELSHAEHLAVFTPNFAKTAGIPLVRVHSECLTGDVFGSKRCDCGPQLERAMELIAKDPVGGATIYLRGHEGRGIGLFNKIKAYALQDQGLDTVEANERLGFEADQRDYHDAARVLRRMGVRKVRLLTNNPQKVEGLKRYGIEVVERVPLDVGANSENKTYLRTKIAKFNHKINQNLEQ
ncbi:MAG: 3,4-dihydroxy-2-butanone-4-phosphate synthase [Bdellovibrionales bacterium]|nr:3,4-dihydroxy-2-butanone-4-phosphate synthase [Bdellovibrionales bacterium]